MIGNLDIRSAGDRALLLVPDDLRDLVGLVAAVRQADLDLEDVLPAAETLLVTLRRGADREAVVRGLREQFASHTDDGLVSSEPDEVVEIPVRYGGEDLADVAELLGMSAAEVVAQHTSALWRCGFIGFAPGFGYLTSPDWSTTVPRRRHPRTAVPAGSVAVADAYSAVYPRSSPGGWQIIGTTDAPMWDLQSRVPNLIAPGTRVRFVLA